jgi:hypothetical protein
MAPFQLSQPDDSRLAYIHVCVSLKVVTFGWSCGGSVAQLSPRQMAVRGLSDGSPVEAFMAPFQLSQPDALGWHT